MIDDFAEYILQLYVMLVNTISQQVIEPNYILKESKIPPKKMRNEIRCSICENTAFKVERIEPEIIILICENCGEIHQITPEIFAHKILYLNFCISNMKK
jgi:hypothetical protein